MSLTLEDVWHELERGRIYEASLRDPKWHLDGLQDGERIYIDPRTAVLETLIHELLHRMRRSWSERRVTSEARRLLGRMSDAEKSRWYRRYQRLKKKSGPVEIADA